MMAGERRRRALLWATGAAAGAAGLVWSLRQHPAPAVNVVAGPGLWQGRFERPEGGELVMAEFSGRVVVLNFWATWCPPCVDELPELDQLHQRWHSRGAVVIGLAIDEPAAVRQFLQRKPLSFPVGLAGFAGSDLSRELGNEAAALPFTAVLDRTGRVRERKLGRTRLDELERWLTAVSRG